MRRYTLLISALAVPSAVHATVYMSPEQAQAAMFPGEVLRPASRQLTPAQVAEIRRTSGEAPLSKDLHAWRSSSGGWFIVDQVVGKHEFITFALALDPSGAVKALEILEYKESYGSQVRERRWWQQFIGKRAGQPLQLGREVKNISGATLSSKHVTDGVRRLLVTYAIVLARDV